jgi:NADH:ubiquinone oxidoreductase subunit B-like Fe-S oxidoreductase
MPFALVIGNRDSQGVYRLYQEGLFDSWVLEMGICAIQGIITQGISTSN